MPAMVTHAEPMSITGSVQTLRATERNHTSDNTALEHSDYQADGSKDAAIGPDQQHSTSKSDVGLLAEKDFDRLLTEVPEYNHADPYTPTRNTTIQQRTTQANGSHANDSQEAIRKETGDSNLISATKTQESTQTSNSSLASLPPAEAFKSPNRRNWGDDRNIVLPDRDNAEGFVSAPGSPMATPDGNHENTGWGRLFNAADGWLDRLRSTRPEDGEAPVDQDQYTEGAEADGGERDLQEGREATADQASRKWISSHQRRSTVADIPRNITARKSPFRRQSSVEHYDSGNSNANMFSITTLRREHGGTSGSGGNASGGPSPANLQRWKDIRARLQFINFTKKKKEEEAKHDHQKSAELLSELSAGAPAAVIIASAFQKDSKGRSRLPVLLEQLKVRISDSTRTQDRQHTLFRIELEYGSGPIRMKWVIFRDFRDFFALHSHFRAFNFTRNIYSSTTGGATMGGAHAIEGLPRFPREAIPYLRGVRGLKDVAEAEADMPASRGGRRDSSRHSITSFSGEQGHVRNAKFAQTQRQSLEDYLKNLISIMIFRGEANRLCRFLELSAMGIRLSVENSYHGKEGQLSIISTSSARGWRTAKLGPKNIKALFTRYGAKWFLIRHSYVLVVDSMFDVVPIDVFLVDSDFKFTHKTSNGWQTREDAEAEAVAGPSNVNSNNANNRSLTKSVKKSTKVRFTLKLANAERKMKVLTFSEKQMKQWMDSMDYMYKSTPWAQKHRFESFAPVRHNVSAQWFVDGRDYFWNVSHAIDMAQDVIYIHDWWLSPEVYLRRPAHGNQQWRLDRLLKRKAEQGVKIFVILYRNVGAAIPIDSIYTKQSLLDLHPNIFVTRSPNQFRQNILFWAHHEKLVIVDHMILFVGGLDLCFGRWDTPQHVLNDNKPTGFDRGSEVDFGQDTQLWIGKDYSNARVQDFYELNKPYDDMYDRTKVPRMPWHDVHMQMVGQPARDAARHFVQRWNYLIRQKRSTRPTPVLLPPPDFTDSEVEALGHLGTCEAQLLRSASSWSLGFAHDKLEHSIQTAYLKAIEASDHFVYIENQFFITSTSVDGTVIENAIGDALVERILRAAKRDEDWRAIIIIPLMPGFEAEVDQQDGTSVRLIMECQFRSISRGPHSIYSRLERAGVNPEDYIQFFSLRKWGTVGPQDKLVTEQLYIHAKIMIVDDRVAIIGSANINERSMRGSRDSEVAAIIRDTDQIESTMAGAKYMVGRFPHTLRVRLMREHLGIDVDALEDLERRAFSAAAASDADDGLDDDDKSVTLDTGRHDIWSNVAKLRKLTRIPQSFAASHGDMTNEGMYDSDQGESESEDDVDSSEDERDDDEARDRRERKYAFFSPHDDEEDIRDHATDEKAKSGKVSASEKNEAAAGASVPVIDPNDENDKGVLKEFPENQDLSEKIFHSTADSTETSEINRTEHLADVAGYGQDRMSESAPAEHKMAAKVRERLEYGGEGDAKTRGIAVPPGNEATFKTEDPLRSKADPAQPHSQGRLSAGKARQPYLEDEETGQFGSGFEEEGVDPEVAAESLEKLEQLIMALSLAPAESHLNQLEAREILETEPPETLREITPVSFEDPLAEQFYFDIWLAHAVNNTNIYREVFRCQPDNEVRTWKDYKNYQAHSEKFANAQTASSSSPGGTNTQNNTSNGSTSSRGTAGKDDGVVRRRGLSNLGPNNTGNAAGGAGLTAVNNPAKAVIATAIPGIAKTGEHIVSAAGAAVHALPLHDADHSAADTEVAADETPVSDRGVNGSEEEVSRQTNNTSGGTLRRRRRVTDASNFGNGGGSPHVGGGSSRRSRRQQQKDHAHHILDRDAAERHLLNVRGHLVVFPKDWLLKEDEAGNWFYNIDRIPPLEIYD
ncbi:hypothetical protein BZA70DRAFT_286679 [Myxozyma melibiosi]|uniref:phospholipase D n=1 Tax=Myxozyma melibiosi TaxID=54550 RepID=A0ABR1FC36_9ASCO